MKLRKTVDQLTAVIVKVGSIAPIWAVYILDSSLGFHRLDDGGPWHIEPTLDDAKRWANAYLAERTGTDLAVVESMPWEEF